MVVTVMEFDVLVLYSRNQQGDSTSGYHCETLGEQSHKDCYVHRRASVTVHYLSTTTHLHTNPPTSG